MIEKKNAIEAFVEYIQKNGPASSGEIEKTFKKHNELFLRAQGRGLKIKRYTMSAPRKLGKTATWYYAPGQEVLLKERVLGILKSFKEFGNK